MSDLSPKSSPVSLKNGGQRVNKLPLLLTLLGVIIFAVLVVMVIKKRADQQSAQITDISKPEVKSTVTTTKLSDLLSGQSGIVPTNTPTLSIPIAKVDNPDLPPSPSRLQSQNIPLNSMPVQVVATAPTAPERNMNNERINTEKETEFLTAIKAKTTIPISEIRSYQMATNGNVLSDNDTNAKLNAVRQQMEKAQAEDPTTTYQERIKQINSVVGANDSSSITTKNIQGLSNDKNDIHQFSGSNSRWKMNEEVEAPKPYQIRSGSVLPGIMVSGINSDLPGQLIGQVAQDVYDTATGKYLLIPQGTKLVGTYSSDIVYGQSAILIAWQRLVFPDARALDIGAMPGSDSAGYAGFRDQVNNHYWRIFGSAFLMSGITGAISYNQDKTNSAGVYSAPTASSALSEAVGQQLGQVTAQMIQKNLNIAPTLEIRPGYAFNVVVTKDLDLKKTYKEFQY